MSDLISRSALLEAMENTEKEYENAMTCPSWLSAYSVIKEQPTAYDKEAVIEQLKEVGKLQITTHGGRCNGKTLTLGYVKGIENAIEIVKAGGSSEQ